MRANPISALPFALLVLASTAGATEASLPELPHFELQSPLLAAATKAPAKKPAAKTEKTDKSDKSDDATAPVPDSDDAAKKAADKEVKYGGAVVGQAIGGATGFVFKQGFYTQSDLGGFFRFGGFADDASCGFRCKPVPTSRVQPFIGLSVGYDLAAWLGVQLSFGTGFIANAAPFEGSPDSPRDYGLTFINAGVVGSYYFLDRLAVVGKVFGGASFLSPEPDKNVPAVGGNFGAGLGLRYATLLTDVFVGFDANFYASMSPNGGGGLLFIPGISFAPVIKYVF